MNKLDYQGTLKYILENVKMSDLIKKYNLTVRKESDDRSTMICPFHAEDTPSLKIYGDDSFFCFGCGAGNNVVNFIQLYENIDFVEVINRYKDKNNYSSLDITLDSTIERPFSERLKSSKDMTLEYYYSSKFILGVKLRERYEVNPDKVKIIDDMYRELHLFYGNMNNLDVDRIEAFEEHLLTRMNSEL